ncbi:MAG TPA: low molecular weight phosphatase family protein [Candidatus Paceibacterota bacterium]|nr:low molecular weight phosphatase family protein [Candidatus Paceibacterota bacterium]
MMYLFLCKGNVGRSQMAEALFEKYVSDKGNVISAGTALSGPEQTLESLLPGTENVLKVLEEEGINALQKKRKQLTDVMIASADKIILISTDPTPENLNNNEKLEYWNIADPKGMSLEDTRKIKNQIKEKILEL